MDLLNAINSEDKDYDSFLQDLLSVHEDLPASKDEINNLQTILTSCINSRLNQSVTRKDGFNILINFLPKCPKDILSKYAVLWIAKASQVLEESHATVQEISLACRVLSILIVRCKDNPDLHKSVSMQTVKQLITAISQLQFDKKSGAPLFVVATILYHYKEPSERLQSSVKRMILPLLDSNKKNLVQAGANCYMLLARVTERSFKPPPGKPTYTAWIYNQALLCNSLHAIMDDFFTGVVELEDNDIWEKLDLPSISEDNVIEYYQLLERRFQNLCTYLSTMLRGCSGKNSVLPIDILQLVCRGLAVTPSGLKNQDSFKKQMLHFILPKLHLGLFRVLNAFIEGFKEELIPFTVTILQLYQQTLKWTEKMGESKTTISGVKPFESVRIAVYESLSTWLSCLGTLSGIDIAVNEFSIHILKDIIPEKEQVLLTVQNMQHLSKRALKRYKDSQYENSVNLGSANVEKKDFCANARLCKAALSSLKNIFFSASHSLKQGFYKSVQNAVVPLLYDYYLGKCEDTFYNADFECRLNLLQVLRAIQLNPHPSTPPPIQYAIEISTMALGDVNPRIVEEAKLMSVELEKIAHPSAPSLHCPLRSVEDPGEKELGIHWRHPAMQQEPNLENGVESNVWDNVKSMRNGSISTEEAQQAGTSTSEVTKPQKPCQNDNERSESFDGPTPSKQQKLTDNEQVELMDTSEDDIVVVNPQKDDSNAIEKIPPPETEKKIDSPEKSDDSPSYFTLKEIQCEENKSSNVTDSQNTTSSNDNEKSMSEDSVMRESALRSQQEKLAEESDDESMLVWFCDEPKDDS